MVKAFADRLRRIADRLDPQPDAGIARSLYAGTYLDNQAGVRSAVHRAVGCRNDSTANDRPPSSPRFVGTTGNFNHAFGFAGAFSCPRGCGQMVDVNNATHVCNSTIGG